MAKYLTWEEVIKLPKNQPVWIQYSRYELIRDTIRYDENKDVILQEYEMCRYTNASHSYRRTWVIWDSLPAEEQFLKEEWRI